MAGAAARDEADLGFGAIVPELPGGGPAVDDFVGGVEGEGGVGEGDGVQGGVDEEGGVVDEVFVCHDVCMCVCVCVYRRAWDVVSLQGFRVAMGNVVIR